MRWRSESASGALQHDDGPGLHKMQLTSFMTEKTISALLARCWVYITHTHTHTIFLLVHAYQLPQRLYIRTYRGERRTKRDTRVDETKGEKIIVNSWAIYMYIIEALHYQNMEAHAHVWGYMHCTCCTVVTACVRASPAREKEALSDRNLDMSNTVCNNREHIAIVELAHKKWSDALLVSLLICVLGNYTNLSSFDSEVMMFSIV